MTDYPDWKHSYDLACQRAAQLEAERQQWIAKLQAYDDIERANGELAQRVRELEAERKLAQADADLWYKEFENMQAERDGALRKLEQLQKRDKFLERLALHNLDDNEAQS